MATAHVVTKKLPPRLLSSVVVGPPESSRGGREAYNWREGCSRRRGGERTDSLEPSVRTSCSTSIATLIRFPCRLGHQGGPHSVKMGSRQPKGACFWAPEDNVKSHVSPWASVCSMVPAVH